jgi:hypothetical protein
MPSPDELCNGAAHRVADGNEPIDSQGVGNGNGIVRAILEAESLPRSKARAVTAMVECDDPVRLTERRIALEPVQVSCCSPTVEENEGDSGVAWPEIANQDRAPLRQLEKPPVRKFRHSIGYFEEIGCVGDDRIGR